MEGAGVFSELGDYDIEYILRGREKSFYQSQIIDESLEKEKKLWSKICRQGFMGQDIILKERQDSDDRKGRKGRAFLTAVII